MRPSLPLLLAVNAVACASGAASEAEQIVALLRLEPGMIAADVGAGDGEWSLPLARAVGPDGLVLATEVDDDKVSELQELARREDLPWLRAIRGNDVETGLDADCCDAVLLRKVYHHFTQPALMRAQLRRALRPGGRLLVVDLEPQRHWPELDGVPDRGGHGIPFDDLVADLEGDGFRILETHRPWQGDDDEFAVLAVPR